MKAVVPGANHKNEIFCHDVAFVPSLKLVKKNKLSDHFFLLLLLNYLFNRI